MTREGRRRFLGVLGSSTLGMYFWGTKGLSSPKSVRAQGADPLQDKDGLRILSDRPLTVETPVTLLDDDITPNSRHFVRNNGLLPERALSGDLSDWTLTVDGEVETPLSLDLDALKQDVEQVMTTSQDKDVLQSAGLKDSAVFVAYYGEDPHLGGDPDRVPISRGVPIEKALDENTLLAWEMNGVPLPPVHGFPLRLVAPGWPGSASGKWLKRLWVRDREHDGPKMTAYSYRMPKYPVAPGTEVPEEDMKMIEAMPVKSIITRPKTGVEIRFGESLSLRGHAWCGDGLVKEVHLSFDFAQTWVQASLAEPRNPLAWQRWDATLEFPTPGHYEVWARATDHRGRQQPMVVPGWNPRGYLNNAMQRISVRVS